MPRSESAAVPRPSARAPSRRTTGQFLFALVAPQWDCEVLEIGASRGYSSIWLGAGVRNLGGHLLSLESDPAKIDAWRPNISEAGLEEWVELIEGDAAETIPEIDDVFDIVFLDAEKEDYERLFQAARKKLEPGALVIADNVLSHPETLRRLRRGPQADPTLESVTVPARPRPRAVGRPDGGSRPPGRLIFCALTAERRWSESGDFQYGQWRYQRVEVCPRDLRGIA